jgi:hypothetical protein
MSEADETARGLVTKGKPTSSNASGSKRSSSASVKSATKSKRSSSASGKGAKGKADRASYYQDMIEPFKKTEVHSMSKLDRLKKDGTIGDDSGMGDAVAKTEAIRNWREQCMGELELATHLKTDAKLGLTAA